MNSLAENQINKFISNKILINRKILSEAFNIRCEKICLENNEFCVAKYYVKKNNNFNSIVSETKSLNYLSKKFPNLFPKIQYKSSDLLIIDFIKHNNIKNKNYQILIAKNILKLHAVSNDKYGFNFDAQIGGLKQSNTFESNWISFFREKRLNMIFEKINETNKLPNFINKKIEKLLKDLENRLPKNPKISLLHGDLWSGNILFNDGDLVSFIDPGIYFAHNELEISYLKWFNFIDEKFIDYYSNIIKIDKSYFEYEAIYQLYFNLLNVYLWSRDYIKNTEFLLNKIYQTHGLGSDK